MATARAAIESVLVQGVPYVGLRPFERHERDRFFGRERDAEILCNRILSGRLTILYALSGLGKSSLLRALVVPKLEANHARVVYFDTWAHQDPLQALKATLATLASELGMPDLDPCSLSLVEMVRMLSGNNDRSLVLICDQFEEFLVRNAQNLDPLRSELAALVRSSKLDVAVVLTLREEFLASLEPFRHQILNLFQSAYRLESLCEEDLAKAIGEPARMFGGDCEKELIEALICDLEGETVAVTAGPQLSLGLPMLQLVCQELWRRAPDRQLSLALYEALGRTQRIIDDYVRGLMPKERRRQIATANLLIYLAPPSGLKMSYSVEDLAGITSLPPTVIGAELKRLEAARILRPREYTGRGVRYELEHDAFIPVLKTWREEILKRKRHRDRKWRLARRASVAFVVLIAVGLGLARSHKNELERQAREFRLQQQGAEQRVQMNEVRLEKQLSDERANEEASARTELEGWQTGGLFTDLAKKPKEERERLSSSYFNMLVDFVLRHQTGEERLNQLRDTLQQNESLVPVNYDNETPSQLESGADEGWPLELHYSSSRAMDPVLFALMWRDLATQVAGDTGIPVPLKVLLVADENVPRERMQVVASGQGASSAESSTDLDVPIYRNQFLIASSLADVHPGPARDFLERFRGDWVQFPQRQDWLLVPRWSAPVWKAAGTHPITPSGIDAFLAVRGLLDKPRTLFSDDAVEALLRHAREFFPQTVAEAQLARGDNLGFDLADRVEKRRDALLNLPEILDHLAEQPRSTTLKMTANVRPESAQQTGKNLMGPWQDQTGQSKVTKSSSRDLAALGAGERNRQLAFLELESQLPEFLPIRVYVGDKLVPEWFPNRKDLSDHLATEVDELRDEFYRSYGVRVPPYRFRPPRDGDALPSDAIRIEVEGDPPWVSDIHRISGPDTVKSLITVLRDADERNMDRWITAETTEIVLNQLPPNSRKWLESKYSLTDLKRLLRASVKPGSSAARPLEGGARYSAWLINSLLFWALVDENPMDLKRIAKDLRETERARLNSPAQEIPATVTAEIRQHLDNGIRALVDDDVKKAENEFGEGKRLDPNTLSELFPLLWSQSLPEVWLRDFKRTHKDLGDVLLSNAERLDSQELAASCDRQRNPQVWRELSLYRLAAGEFRRTDEEARTVADLLARFSPPNEWPPDQASWLALRFLRQYDPLDPKTGDSQLLASASALLEGAVRNFPDQDRAHQAFMGVVDISRKSVAPDWSEKLLNRLAELRPGGIDQNLQLERAWELSGEERSDRLLHALELAENYEKIVASSQLEPDVRLLAADNVSYVRAKSYFRLARQGEEQYRAEAERLFRGLLASRNDTLTEAVQLDLIQMLYEGGNDQEAKRLNKAAEEKWPDEPGFFGSEMLAQLRRANVNGVAAVTRLVERRASLPGSADDDKARWLFLAALGSLLTQSSSGDPQKITERFLATKHDYTDYILMLDYALSEKKPASAKLLKDRWAMINPSTWSERIRSGDASAWREMLIGRFMGAPESARLFDLVQHEEAWKKSELSHLAEPLRGQLCEAWFYDALIARANGSPERMRESLRRSIETGYLSYYEYGMAVFLLSQVQPGN